MPHRLLLLDLLDRYAWSHPDEEPTVRAFRSFVADQPKCFERSLEHGHVTGSAWLTSPAGDRVLLTHHRKLGAWFQLGGHADGEANVLTVAMREAREESGIEEIAPVDTQIFDLDIHEIPARRSATGATERAHLHYDVRFCLRALPGHHLAVVSPESIDLKWLVIDDLGALDVDQSIHRMARKWRERLETEAISSEAEDPAQVSMSRRRRSRLGGDGRIRTGE